MLFCNWFAFTGWNFFLCRNNIIGSCFSPNPSNAWTGIFFILGQPCELVKLKCMNWWNARDDCAAWLCIFLHSTIAGLCNGMVHSSDWNWLMKSLIICISINDTVGNSYYTYVASSDRMIVNRELERLWKEKTWKLVFLFGDCKVVV